MSDLRTRGALRLALLPLGVALIVLAPLLSGTADDPDLVPIKDALVSGRADGSNSLHAVPLDPGPCGGRHDVTLSETTSAVTLRMTYEPPGSGGHTCGLPLQGHRLRQPLGDRAVIDASTGSRLVVHDFGTPPNWR